MELSLCKNGQFYEKISYLPDCREQDYSYVAKIAIVAIIAILAT